MHISAPAAALLLFTCTTTRGLIDGRSATEGLCDRNGPDGVQAQLLSNVYWSLHARLQRLQSTACRPDRRLCSACVLLHAI